MGADLIVSTFPWPSTKDGTPLEPGEALAAEVNRRVFALTDKELGLALDQWLEIRADSFEEIEDDKARQRAERAVIANLLDEWFGPKSLVIFEPREDDKPWLGTARRDLGTWRLRGFWYVVTGGMSWGDDPTDSFDEVNALAGLYDVLVGEF